MPLLSLADLRQTLPRQACLIGLDPGTVRVGLAVSDVGLVLATPAGTMLRGKLAANARDIAALVKKTGAGGLVVGLPLEMDGRFGPAAQAAKDWARAVADAVGLPVATWDERLSSAAVNRMLISEGDLTRAKRAKAVDGAAAAYMLQAALDATRPPATLPPPAEDS
ncbi:Holliday junction resolvase RuvX [Humitalea sp. 24SJ18S-53]|uniref:Holliday junction resolvase RuvX n=1 Tax=Humitalea sp. 24SJ18S-53 TaxID=3422307 RepID=UPI003D67505C